MSLCVVVASTAPASVLSLRLCLFTCLFFGVWSSFLLLFFVCRLVCGGGGGGGWSYFAFFLFGIVAFRWSCPYTSVLLLGVGLSVSRVLLLSTLSHKRGSVRTRHRIRARQAGRLLYVPHIKFLLVCVSCPSLVRLSFCERVRACCVNFPFFLAVSSSNSFFSTHAH